MYKKILYDLDLPFEFPQHSEQSKHNTSLMAGCVCVDYA